MSQSTLGEFGSSTSARVEVQSSNSSRLSEAHINYLIEHFSPEFLLQKQIEDKLSEEKAEMDDIQARYREFSQYDDSPKSRTEYIRVRRT